MEFRQKRGRPDLRPEEVKRLIDHCRAMEAELHALKQRVLALCRRLEAKRPKRRESAS